MARQWFMPGIGFPFQGGMIDEDGVDEYFVPSVGILNEDQAAGDIDTAEKRKSVSGLWLPLIPGVTPNSGKDAEWRAEAGWSYSGIAFAPPSPVDPLLGGLALLGVGR